MNYLRATDSHYTEPRTSGRGLSQENSNRPGGPADGRSRLSFQLEAQGSNKAARGHAIKRWQGLIRSAAPRDYVRRYYSESTSLEYVTGEKKLEIDRGNWFH